MSNDLFKISLNQGKQFNNTNIFCSGLTKQNLYCIKRISWKEV